MHFPESKLKRLWGFIPPFDMSYHFTIIHTPVLNNAKALSPHQAWKWKIFLTDSKESYFELLPSILVEPSPFLSASLTRSTTFPAADLLHLSKRSSYSYALVTRNDAYQIMNCITQKQVA